MHSYVSDILNQLPPKIPRNLKMRAFSSDRLAVLETPHVFSQPHGFSTYKFVVSTTPSHPLHRVEQHLHAIGQNQALPINPDQPHGALQDGLVSPYWPVFVHPELMREVARAMFGSRHVWFENAAFKLNRKLVGLLAQFRDEALHKNPGHEFMLQSLSVQIAVTLLRQFDNNLVTHQAVGEGVDKGTTHQRISAAIEFLHENLARDFSLEEVASVVNYSPYHFLRLFKEATGKTPFDYVLELKLARAQELLRTTTKSVLEISLLAGFSNRTHFSATFKKRVGLSPSAYRRQVQ